jgi:hypothetical protein
MAVTVRSVSQILSDMVRRVLAETALTDVSAGSVLSTILEAASLSDYQNNLAVLKLLESSRIESLVGTDLDAKAVEMAIPNGTGGFGRKPATRATGLVTVYSSFTKKMSNIYRAKPSPYAGGLHLYVQDARNWPSSGQVYVGRGTVSEEGPIPYSSISFHVNYYDIQLSYPLIKNHKYEDTVILSQGGVRSVSAGTVVVSPAVDDTPQVQFFTDSAAKLLDGEDSVSVNVTSAEFGESGNVAAKAIKSFSSTPFSGATVTNLLAFANGQPAESDEQLRQRIRNHYATLSRGTRLAILGSLQGLRDPDSGKTISSINLVEPILAGETAKCFIDDGAGLEPTFSGQSFENILPSAYGQETLFRTSKAPISPCFINGSNTGPFQLTHGWSMTVRRDGINETFTIRTEDFLNINSVQAPEIVNAFNTQGLNVGFRTASGGNIVSVFDLQGSGESLSILPGDLQELLGFPLTETRSIFLYKNGNRLSFKGTTAKIQSNAFPWVALTDNDVVSCSVKVDGVLQTFSISDVDFQSYGTSIQTASIDQWVSVFKKKVAGGHFYTVLSAEGQEVMVFETWQTHSNEGMAEVITGDWVGNGKIWPIETDVSLLSSVGSAADFDFNRLSGQIRLLNRPDAGDTLTLGSLLTRGMVYSFSAPTGRYSIGVSDLGNPRVIVGFDAIANTRTMNIPSSTPVQFSSSGSLVRANFGTGNDAYIYDIKSGDFIYLVRRESLGTDAIPAVLVGMYRVKYVSGASIYFLASEEQAVLFDALPVVSFAPDTFIAFGCENACPQIVDLGTDAVMTADGLISALNAKLLGGEAVKISPRRIALRSHNYDYLKGNVAVFAAIGNAGNVFEASKCSSLQSHVAFKKSERIDCGFAKAEPVSPTLPAAFFPTRGYLKFKTSYSTILDSTDENPPAENPSFAPDYFDGFFEMPITTQNFDYTYRVYNNSPIYPYPGFIKGKGYYRSLSQSPTLSSLERYEGKSLRFEDLPISYTDTLVTKLDEDEVNGIFGINMGKKVIVTSMSTISGGAKGSQISFTLKDPEDGLNFSDQASIYRTFDLTDFSVMFRPYLMMNMFAEETVSKLPDYSSKQTLIMYGSQYGQTSRIKATAILPSSQNSPLQVYHKNYFENGSPVTHLYTTLPSGSTSYTYTKAYTVEVSSYDVPDFASKITKFTIRAFDMSPISPGGEFKVGDILVIGGLNGEYSGSYPIIESTSDYVVVATPGLRKSSYSAATKLDPLVNPLFSMANPGVSVATLVDSMNSIYYADNPLFTVKFIGSDRTKIVKYPTYFIDGNNTEYLDSTSISDSIDYHSKKGNFPNKAGIHSYNQVTGVITATVQNTETVLPTSMEMLGTSYSYIGEEIYLVPSTVKAMKDWLSFTAVSGLSVRAKVTLIEGNRNFQIASLQQGSSGAVSITGVTANAQQFNLTEVPSDIGSGVISCSVPFATAQSLPRGSLLELANTVPMKYGRTYKTVPSNQTGYSVITSFNTPDTTSHFKDSTEVVYDRITIGVGRFTFKNNAGAGYVPGSSSIVISKASDGIAKITATGTNILAARVGDMMIIHPSTGSSYACTALIEEAKNKYIGYPVVHVASLSEIYVIAPNVDTVDKTVTLTQPNHLQFSSVPWAEKNIKTNYLPGILFGVKEAGKDQLYYRIKVLGSGLVYAEFSYGSSSARYDLDMKLDNMMVNSDDWIEFAGPFSPENLGKFRIVAHNGKDALIFVNHLTGGVDEMFDSTEYWGMGPVGDADVGSSALDKRLVRIYDSESVSVGDYFSISSPADGTAVWFDNSLLSSWKITEIGFNTDYEPYVICDISGAPATSVSVLLSSSASALSFKEPEFSKTETHRIFGYKWVNGFCHSTRDTQTAEMYLSPQTSLRKILPSYGTQVTCLHKIGMTSTIDRGLDAYQYYTELIAHSHKVIDGSSSNPIDYPGVRAVGSSIEVLPPLVKSILMNLTVTPGEGVDLNGIKLQVKSSISSYINGLGVGREVVLSEVVKRIQQVPGVKSVIINSTSPIAANGIISTGSYEVARIVDQADISI